MGFKLSQVAGVVSTIDAAAQTIGTYTGDAIDMSKFDRVLFILDVGTMLSSATLDLTIGASTTSGGVYADLSGKAITQLTAAGSDWYKQAIIEVTTMDVKAAGKRWIKPTLIALGSTSDAAVIGVGYRPRYGPITDNDLSSVDEVV